MRRVLFVCSRNKLRSPTSEAVFSGIAGIEVSSAGTDPTADCPVSGDLIEWADDVFAMEPRHRERLRKRFGKML